MKEKKITKQDITTTDALYIVFTIVLSFCFIAIAVTDILLIISSFIAISKAASLAASTIKIIGLAIMVLLCSALFVYLDYLIFKTLYTKIKSYLVERKELLEQLNNPSSQDSNS